MLGACRALAVAAPLLIPACHSPEIGAEHARSYFAAHRIEFERVAQQVKLCQPDSGRIDYVANFRCWSSDGTRQDVLDAMRAANASWIRANYNEQEGEERTLTSVNIAMPSSYGFSFAGVIEAFRYETEPAIDAVYERQDNGIATTERLPVTDTPHHWYWWKIKR